MKQALSTKTLDAEMIAYAETLGLAITCVDVVNVASVTIDKAALARRTFDTVVFTSANAARFLSKQIGLAEIVTGKNIFSISGRTNKELQEINVNPIITAKSAEELADKIAKAGISKNVLHPCGNLRLDIIENKLKAAGINYYPLTVYSVTPNSVKVNEIFDAILFFSPSGVDSFLTENNLPKHTIACCIGDTTALALKQKQPSAVLVTSTLPSSEAMIKATADYFKNNTKEA